MSAWLSPTRGRAAEVFSTLTAITGLPLTLPPVSGSLVAGLGVAVIPDGVGVGVVTGAEEDGAVVVGGTSEPLQAPTPPTRTTAVTTAAPARARRPTHALMADQNLGDGGRYAGRRPAARRAARGTS